MHVTIWMNLEIIMLSKRNQSQDYILYDSIYIACPKQGNVDRKWIYSCLGLGREGNKEKRGVRHGHGISFRGDKMF